MQPANFIKGALLALVISFIAIISWEFYLRHHGFGPSYDDNEALWAHERAMVYEPRNLATVFIGSSRIKYDLDIPTWQELTGDHAIQLANTGSNPRPFLQDLANDENFKGKLVIDVTEGLFFRPSAPDEWETNKKIAYYHHITPTQRFSFQVDRVLESKLALLDQYYFSINALMDHIKMPDRKEVVLEPLFPPEFDRTSLERQNYMTPKFVADTNLQKQVQGIWGFFGKQDTSAPVSGAALDSIFYSVKRAVDKIKSRGGQVLFVRTPSSGFFRQVEIKNYPRAVYWDRLLAITGCPGIYFEDYPATAHMVCPEWSHLKPEDAVIYTYSLVKSLEEKGWTFKRKPEML